MEQYQDQVVQSQPVQDTEIYANMMQEERVRNVLSQLSPDSILNEAHWKLKGYIKNSLTGQWEKLNPKQKEPHPQLISDIMGELSSIVNQNTTMSNLTIEEVNQLMNLQIQWYVDYMKTNAELFGIEHDYPERTRIGNILHKYSFMALKRAIGGMESKRIFESLSLSENFNPEKKKAGLWDALKGVVK